MNTGKSKFNLFYFLLSFIITLGTGFLSYIFTKSSMVLYEKLKKPSFTPPDIIFFIVWTVLFILMGLALYRILKLKDEGKNIKKAVLLFSIQLVLNFLWSIIFFRKRLIFMAFLELILLVIFIILTIIEFFKKDKIAGILLIPYVLWCIFAGVLNYFVWFLNA
ncbi:TspO/MBR family protein [Hathewaya limosa]|uniref:Tryptophan-rich sensory protein n=1 Tax=Hathewaya limosa TaxID=1536 RepID=A0ABU0JQP0_HATLI|nr:TspO/MBR family protein [Hathewaya limosa]MDQ0479384.1 tryptophan-rich sensory protein [Hathewaya limosa]